jgi:hypothetical protein
MSPTLFAVLLTVAAPAPAEEETQPPKGPPPLAVLARMDKDGNFEITRPTTVYRQETRTHVVTVNGQAVEQTHTVAVPTTVNQTVLYAAKSVKVYGIDGKEVEQDRVADVLRQRTVILLSANGQSVDPFYLKVVRPGTLILVGPATGDGAPAVGAVPAPVPPAPPAVVPPPPAKK